MPVAGQEVWNRSLDLLAELLNRWEKLGAGAAGGWERGTTCQSQSWRQTELRAVVFYTSLWKCSCHEERAAWVLLTLIKSETVCPYHEPAWSQQSLTFCSGLYTTRSHLTKEQIRLSLTGIHANPPHPGGQMGAFLPQAPSPLVELRFGGTSE